MGNNSVKKDSIQPKKRKWLRIVLVILLLLSVAIQFIQPDKNNNDVLAKNDISSMVNVPDTVRQLLKVACNDCHSNFTIYPWYTNIQPVGLWMAHHIDDGKRHLNFNEFTNLKPWGNRTVREMQLKKMEEIKKMIEEGEMPLSSYTLIHTNARLTEGQKKLITNWADSARLIIGKLPAQ